MLRLPAFELHQPSTLAEAAALLAAASEGSAPVRLVAGGTDLYPNLKRRHQRASRVVSLSKVPGLVGVTAGEETHIGAMTTLSKVAAHPHLQEHYPAFTRAVASISAPVLRNMGTLGGNLCLDTRCTYYNQNEEWRQSIHYCMKAEGEVCWVAPGSPRCWAVSSSDSAPMLAALDATVRLVSSEGERTIPVEALYQDDGMAYLTKRPEEILVEVLLPEGSRAGSCRSSFWKLRRRGAIDFAVLSVAADIWLDEAGLVRNARVFLGAVASYPTPATATVAALLGKPLTAENITAAAALSRKDATPMDNTDFTPPWRGAVLAKYVEAVLRECAGLAVERLAPKHPG